MFSDTYPLKLVNDVLYEVTGKVILTIIILARSPLEIMKYIIPGLFYELRWTVYFLIVSAY